MVELSCEGDVRYAKSFTKSYGGDTINTAVAARRLGSSAGFLTRIGDDPFAHVLKETLIQEGIDVTGVKSIEGQTGLYFVSVDADAQRKFYYYRKNSTASTLGPEDVNPNLVSEANIVYSSGITLALSESARKAVLKAFKIAKDNGKTTAFDPNFRSTLWKSQEAALDALNEIIPLVDIILPSCPEDTEKIIGFNKPDQIIDYFLYKGVQMVVVKAGEQGCYLGFKNQKAHIPAMNIKPVDTTGAGDAFNGGFLHGLTSQQSLLDCAKLGNTAAGLKVLNRGSLHVMPYKDAVYSRVFS